MSDEDPAEPSGTLGACCRDECRASRVLQSSCSRQITCFARMRCQLSLSSSREVIRIAPQRKDLLMSPRKRSAATKSGELVCPECGKTFTRPRHSALTATALMVSPDLRRVRRRAGGKTATGGSKRGASSHKTATAPRTSRASRTSAPNASGAGRIRRVRRSSDGRAPQWIVTACFSRSSRPVSLRVKMRSGMSMRGWTRRSASRACVRSKSTAVQAFQ